MQDQADALEMTLHPSKCQFLTTNKADTIPFQIDDITISYTTKYTYLGATVSDANISEQIYTQLNPDLTPSPALSLRLNAPINEQDRIAYTRIRLDSHYLKIETGRWSRIPLERRISPCGLDIQSEIHVITNCPLTHHLHTQMNLQFNSACDLFYSHEEYLHKMASYCKQVLKMLC